MVLMQYSGFRGAGANMKKLFNAEDVGRYCGVLILAFWIQGAFSESRLLWGDTHVHSAYSADAYMMGNRSVTPEEAYRFAKGEPVIHPFHRSRVQIEAPLDFIVVADHAENLGVLSEVYLNGVQLDSEAGLFDRLRAWLAERAVRKRIDTRDFSSDIKTQQHTSTDPREAAREGETVTPQTIINADKLIRKTWLNSIALADEYNEPGVFTAFIGWEWSSAPGAANLHRVIVSNANSEKAANFRPFSANDSLYPEDLWRWLEGTAKANAVDFIAIPHNSNISKGFMFAEASLRGKAIDEDFAKLRLQWEPVVEVSQIKGDSETHSVLSPQDEFADFESYLYTFDVQQGPPTVTPQKGDYIRSGLLRGLRLESRIGVNPYQFGMIGSTDSHTGLSTAAETSFGGKFAVDSTPESKGPADEVKGVSGWSMSAQGLAAVWAEDNTRDAILAAFKRREVYATTGPRIALRVHAVWDQEGQVQGSPDLTTPKSGVPMGGILPPWNGGVPTLHIRALKAPNGANLDRVQVVKGWLDNNHYTHEEVYNVAWSGDRELDAEGMLASVGDTVDRSTGRNRNVIGEASLEAVWQDSNFNPDERAFYYVRVLEIPTARHTFLDALALGRGQSPEGDSIIQERAYCSPIWFRPTQ